MSGAAVGMFTYAVTYQPDTAMWPLVVLFAVGIVGLIMTMESDRST